MRLRIVIVAVTAGILVSPALGFAGPLDREPPQQRFNPAAENMLRVPGVVGTYENEAMSSLQQAGLAVDVKRITKVDSQYEGKEGMVIKQVPSSGGMAMIGSSVTLTVYFPPGTEIPASTDVWSGGEGGVDEGWASPSEDGETQNGEEVDPNSDTGWVPPAQSDGNDYED